MMQSKSRLDSGIPRLWTFEEAQAATPYISSVARSLREHYLQVLAKRRELQLLAGRHGRPERKALIQQQEARRDLHKAEQDYQNTLEELSELNVRALAPGQGTAVVPFVQDDQPAWYVFDLFDSQPIRSWRYQSDPDETRQRHGRCCNCAEVGRRGSPVLHLPAIRKVPFLASRPTRRAASVVWPCRA